MLLSTNKQGSFNNFLKNKSKELCILLYMYGNMNLIVPELLPFYCLGPRTKIFSDSSPSDIRILLTWMVISVMWQLFFKS